jgi:porin
LLAEQVRNSKLHVISNALASGTVPPVSEDQDPTEGPAALPSDEPTGTTKEPEPGSVLLPSRALNLMCLRSIKAPVGRAQHPGQELWTRDFLTGNWGGRRDDLYHKGYDINLALFTQAYSVDAGSRGKRSSVDNVAIFSFDYYPEKTGGTTHAQWHLTTAIVQNAIVKDRQTGALNSVFNADALNTSRLFELWYGRKFDDKKGEWRLGKIFPFVRIASSRSACLFSNGAFNYPNFLGFGQGPTYFAAPLGAQLSYQPKPRLFLIGQVSDGYDDPSAGVKDKHGFDFRMSSREGAEGLLEAGFRNQQLPTDKGLPGNYKVGVQFHTGEFSEKAIDTTGGPLGISGGTAREKRGNYGVYAIAEQQLTREGTTPHAKGQGLTVFAKSTVLPGDVNTVSFNAAGGLFYQGAIPGRDLDVVGLGVSHTRYSSGSRRFAADRATIDPTVGVPTAERVIEATYAMQVAPWWVLEFDLQRIGRPSGLASNPNVTAIGISSRWGF